MNYFKKIKLLSALILSLFSAASFAQQSSLSKGVNHISEFIASGYFNSLKSEFNDIQLIDSIYIRAIAYYDGDISEALLALTFTTVPYKKVPIQIPLINSLILYPLVSHNDSVFAIKNDQLPSKLYFNTPPNEYGDRDKLAHFFGSAYISYMSNIFDLGDLIGYFVEVFEETFKVQSIIDDRDLQTNKLGNMFGEMLKRDKNILPSSCILIPSLQLFRYNL